MTSRVLALALVLVLVPACQDGDDRKKMPGGCSVGINPGLGCFVYHDDGDNIHRPVRVWYYLPSVSFPSIDSKIVFIMHGSDRNAEAARKQFLPYADRYSAMLVAPQFNMAYYPNSDDYGRGFVKDGGGTGNFRDRNDWTFLTIEEIFDVIRSQISGAPAEYSIGGNSAGGHFVSRLAWLIPEARYETAAASNAGWYTLPIRNADHPFGIRDLPITDADIEGAYAKEFVLQIGELDTDPSSYGLEHNAFTDAQGLNRYDRAHFCYDYVKADAQARGVPFNWNIVDVPNTGHPAREMAHTTAMAIFEAVYTQPHTSLDPIADTYVVEDEPTNNFGSNEDVRMDGGLSAKTAYMKFDLSGIAPGDFDVAALKIWIHDDSRDTYSVRAVPDSSWTESTLTWVNAPASMQEIGFTSGSYQDGYMYIVITDYVKAYAGSQISFSIESIESINDINEMAFFSKEAADRHPVLALFSR